MKASRLWVFLSLSLSIKWVYFHARNRRSIILIYFFIIRFDRSRIKKPYGHMAECSKSYFISPKNIQTRWPKYIRFASVWSKLIIGIPPRSHHRFQVLSYIFFSRWLLFIYLYKIWQICHWMNGLCLRCHTLGVVEKLFWPTQNENSKTQTNSSK